MNSGRKSRISVRFYTTVIMTASLLALTGLTFAQKGGKISTSPKSTDRDNPVALKSRLLSGQLDGSDDEYFYKFNAGPGKVTVTFEVKANETNAGAYLDLYDSNSEPLLSNILAQGVDRGSERVVESVQLSKRQTIIMRIKGIRYGSEGGRGVFKVQLAGPVNINAR